jgi:hypothetical protein
MTALWPSGGSCTRCLERGIRWAHVGSGPSGMVDSLPRGVVGDLRSRQHERLRYAVDAVANRPWALGR